MIYLKISAILALVTILSLSSSAQTTQPGQAPTPDNFRRVDGTLESLKGQVVTVKSSEDGQLLAIFLPQDIKIITSTKTTLASVKTGDFVGSAAVKGSDGKLYAKEVHIMPGTLRGLGEGHRPMSEPDTSMTNATITDIDGEVSAPEGRTLKLKYKDGTADIQVAPNVPIVTMQAANYSALKPGASVSVGAIIKQGALEARFITVNPPTN